LFVICYLIVRSVDLYLTVWEFRLSALVCVEMAGVLAGGTASGKVGMWKYVGDVTPGSDSGGGGGSISSESRWKLQPPIILNRPVTSLSVRILTINRMKSLVTLKR